MRVSPKTWLASAALALAVACEPHVQGNGVFFEETRPLADFVGVNLESGAQGFVTVGPGLTQTVRVNGDSNIVHDHLHTVVEPLFDGTTTQVVHVYVDGTFTPVIPPRIVITRPSFEVVRGSDATSVTLADPVGATTFVAPPIAVELHDSALLDATAFPTHGAAVDLSGTSIAKLHSDGPVTGTVRDASRLDNNLGAGPCFVTTTAATSTVVCR